MFREDFDRCNLSGDILRGLYVAASYLENKGFTLRLEEMPGKLSLDKSLNPDSIDLIAVRSSAGNEENGNLTDIERLDQAVEYLVDKGAHIISEDCRLPTSNEPGMIQYTIRYLSTVFNISYAPANFGGTAQGGYLGGLNFKEIKSIFEKTLKSDF